MKLPSVQVLRGLAALLVVLYHIASFEALDIARHGGTESALVGGAFANGFAGVDLFFVISGFIMVYVTHGLATHPKNGAEFLIARATRIYPLWWLCALIVALYLIAVNGLPSTSEAWTGITRGQDPATFFTNSFLLIPQAVYPMPSIGWTLIHELYFYIGFAILLAVVPRALWPLTLMAWAVVVIAGAAFGLSAPIARSFAELALHPMTVEFIVGAAAGLLISSSLMWRPGLLLMISSLWLAAALCLHGPVTQTTLLWTRLIVFGLPCAVLVYAIAALDIQKRLVWLAPASLGFLMTLLVFQAYGTEPWQPFAERTGPAFVALCVGTMSALALFWAGWLGGQSHPDRMRALGAPMTRMMNGAAALGDWSYSLYLVHIIVLSALRVVFARLGEIGVLTPAFRLGHEGRLDNILFAATGLLLSIAAARLMFQWFETPVMRFFSGVRASLFRPRRKEAPAE